MSRMLATITAVSIGAAPSWAAGDNEPPPLLFELVINGESFVVEANRQTQLKSTKNPGTTYDVSLQLATNQQWLLNDVRFKYDGRFAVNDDGSNSNRTATLEHELGFSMVVMDLGKAPDDPNEREKLAQRLADSIAGSYRNGGATDLTISKPAAKKFEHSAGYGLTISYTDAGEKLFADVYVLVSGGKACAVILNYKQADAGDARPIAQVTLDSIMRK